MTNHELMGMNQETYAAFKARRAKMQRIVDIDSLSRKELEQVIWLATCVLLDLPIGLKALKELDDKVKSHKLVNLVVRQKAGREAMEEGLRELVIALREEIRQNVRSGQ